MGLALSSIPDMTQWRGSDSFLSTERIALMCFFQELSLQDSPSSAVPATSKKLVCVKSSLLVSSLGFAKSLSSFYSWSAGSGALYGALPWSLCQVSNAQCISIAVHTILSACLLAKRTLSRKRFPKNAVDVSHS